MLLLLLVVLLPPSTPLVALHWLDCLPQMLLRRHPPLWPQSRGPHIHVFAVEAHITIYSGLGPVRRKEDSLWWWLVVVALLLLTDSLEAMGSPGSLDTFQSRPDLIFLSQLSQRFVRSRTSKRNAERKRIEGAAKR